MCSLVFIESNNNLRQRRKWTGNYIREEKNFAEEFRLPLFLLSSVFLVAREAFSRRATGRTSTREFGYIFYRITFQQLNGLLAEKKFSLKSRIGNIEGGDDGNSLIPVPPC